MRWLLLAVAVECGSAETAAPTPRIETGGRVTPWLSVNGEQRAEWMPTGVAFDGRPEGWRLSCLNGVTGSFRPADNGAWTFDCHAEPGN